MDIALNFGMLGWLSVAVQILVQSQGCMVGGYAYRSEDNDTSFAEILDTASVFWLTASATCFNVQCKQYIARCRCIILVENIGICSKPKSSYTVAEPKLSVICSSRSRGNTQDCATIHCPEASFVQASAACPAIQSRVRETYITHHPELYYITQPFKMIT